MFECGPIILNIVFTVMGYLFSYSARYPPP